MTFYLFHQNMRTFGGATTTWNARMKAAFGTLSIGGPGKRVLAAGFTETKNFGTAPDALEDMVLGLDHGLTKSVTLAVGHTAALMGKGKKRKSMYYPMEYISIVTQSAVGGKGFNVLRAGKAVYLQQTISTDPAAGCYPVSGPGSLGTEELPDNAKLDSRGLAYVVGQIKWAGDPLHGKVLVVCFMHNMYAVGDRAGGMMRMPSLVNAIYAKHADIIKPAEVPCVIGGDFNVEPNAVKVRGAASFLPAAEVGPGGNYYKTTGSSVYDWWSCRVNVLTGSAPEIWMATLEKNKPDTLSDHAGISLGLHANLWWP